MAEIPVSTNIQSILQVEQSNLRYLLNIVKDEIKREINCHAIGTIQDFDSVTQTCSVLINYQKVLKQASSTSPDPTGYVDIVIAYPKLIRVPVVFLGGGGSYLTFPITTGDTCLVLFCDRDIDNWLELGSKTNPPLTERLHDLSDAIALVGLNPVTKPISNFNTNTINLSDQTGERLSVTGDIKASFQTQSHSGWLLMDGVSTIGPAGSGATYAGSQYQWLVTLLGGNWSEGGTVTLPQGQGNTLAGYKSGDPNFGTLGAQIGEPTHLLTGPESGIQEHAHGVAAAGVNLGSDVGLAGPFSGEQSTSTGPTDAQEPHNNIQPTLVVNWFIKI